MSTNFWELLQQHQNDLTKSGHMVADYLVQHAAEAQYLSISSLARECKVAEATVFRFCRALGFEGYHEMRIALAQANATGVLVNQQAPSPDADTATLCEHASALFMTAINGTQNALSPEAVDRAVALLRQAKQLMPELKVGALTYGAFLSMVLPPPVVWKDLGLVNSMDEPFSEENCIDLRNNLIYRTVADKVDMLRANFPGETVEQVIGHLEEQADVAAYIKTLDFPVDIVSCEYHTAYSNPDLVNQLHAMGIQAAFWTVDTQDAVRSLLPLGPDCIVTNRPDRVREWVEENQ